MTTEPRPDVAIEASREQWRAVRLFLKDNRHHLAVGARHLYPHIAGVAGTGLLCYPNWVPSAPIELDRVRLGWAELAPAPAIAGTGDESAAVRPLAAGGERFASYADAVGVLDRPALFENRPLYRLLDADLSDPHAARLNLSSGRYFDTVGVSEALAHEFAAAARAGSRVSLDRLPLRAAVGNPCDLSRRPASVAITTLTLRRTRPGEATFLLHWRDPAKVTHAGGLYQVMPVGIFQPADDNPASAHHDLNLWHGMVREFSEELLGASEDYGSLGSPIGYDQWDFYRHLSTARQARSLRLWVLGLGSDPLSLVADMLAVAVFDAEFFDSVFGHLVAVNSEGEVMRNGGAAGFAFTEAVVERFSRTAPMQAAGAAVLRLAWKHRQTLLG